MSNRNVFFVLGACLLCVVVVLLRGAWRQTSPKEQVDDRTLARLDAPAEVSGSSSVPVMANLEATPRQPAIVSEPGELPDGSGNLGSADAPVDPWDAAWREPGSVIEDPRELQLANLALLRKAWIKSMDDDASPVDIHVNGRRVTYCALAGILDSLGRYEQIDGSGRTSQITALDANVRHFQVNNRRYAIGRGEFPIVDRLGAYEEAIRPIPGVDTGTTAVLASLTDQDKADILKLADEALGWMLH